VRWIAWILFGVSVLLLLAWSLCKIAAQADGSDPLGSEQDRPEPDQQARRIRRESVKLGLFLLAVSAAQQGAR
jgi:hypothetical protein